VLISGDRVTVLGEVTGTPAGDLFGVPHTGKSFKILFLDPQTIRDGKLVRTVHMENWLSALTQLRAKWGGAGGATANAAHQLCAAGP